MIEVLRTRVPAPGPDRYLAPDIAGAVELVQTGALLTAAGLDRSSLDGANGLEQS